MQKTIGRSRRRYQQAIGVKRLINASNLRSTIILSNVQALFFNFFFINQLCSRTTNVLCTFLSKHVLELCVCVKLMSIITRLVAGRNRNRCFPLQMFKTLLCVLFFNIFQSTALRASDSQPFVLVRLSLLRISRHNSRTNVCVVAGLDSNLLGKRRLSNTIYQSIQRCLFNFIY